MSAKEENCRSNTINTKLADLEVAQLLRSYGQIFAQALIIKNVVGTFSFEFLKIEAG